MGMKNSAKPEPILIIISGAVPIGIGFAVLVLHGIRHVSILVKPRNIIGADADAVFINCKYTVVLRQRDGKPAHRRKTSEENIQNRLREGVKTCCQHIRTGLHIPHHPCQREIHINQNLSAIVTYGPCNFGNPVCSAQGSLLMGVLRGLSFFIHVADCLVLADIQFQKAGGSVKVISAGGA